MKLSSPTNKSIRTRILKLKDERWQDVGRLDAYLSGMQFALEVVQMIQALIQDGGHHKQWYIEQALKTLEYTA